jgi:hypothetical protein
MSTFDLSNQLAVSAPSVTAPAVPPAAGGLRGSSPEEEAAAALVHLSGASSITVAQVEASITPDLAAASSLVNELTARATSSVIPAAFGSLYTLLNPNTALALTSD